MPEIPESSHQTKTKGYIVQRLQVVQGYYELGMIDDAWEELRGIEMGEEEVMPEYLQMEILLLIRTSKTEEAFELTSRLRELEPDSAAGFVHGAFCLHEMKKTKEALRLLQSAPDCAEEEAVFHYNLACYQAALGDVDPARESLRSAFERDRRLMDQARKDPDLKELRETW